MLRGGAGVSTSVTSHAIGPFVFELTRNVTLLCLATAFGKQRSWEWLVVVSSGSFEW